MLRLLFVSHSVPAENLAESNIGGMQRVASDLFTALQQHPGVTLHSLLLRTSWRWTHVKTPVFMAGLLREIPHAVRRHGIEVVLHSSMVTASTTVAMRKRLRALGVRSAAIAHGRDVTLPNPIYQRLVPRVFDALDAVLPVSRATGEACLQRGLDAHKLQVVPNGIDVDRLSPPSNRREARADLVSSLVSAGVIRAGYQLPSDVLLLCSVGRQVERKGFAWFVDQVVPRLPGDVHYWLAGEGPESAKIRSRVEAHGLEQRVLLLGRVPEEVLKNLYRAADLFIMPNVPVAGDMEGFGVVMLEAGLSGTPVVASDLEGIRDVVAEGLNGRLVPSGDAAAFERAIRTYYGDRHLLREAGGHAYRYVRDTFSWSRVADRYVQVLSAQR